MQIEKPLAIVRLEKTYNRPTTQLIQAVENGLLSRKVLCEVAETHTLTSQQPPLFDCMHAVLSGVTRIVKENPGAAVYAHSIPINIELTDPYFSGDIVVTGASIPFEGHVLHIGSDDNEPVPADIMAVLLDTAGKASAEFAEPRRKISTDSMQLLWLVVKTISSSVLRLTNEPASIPLQFLH